MPILQPQAQAIYDSMAPGLSIDRVTPSVACVAADPGFAGQALMDLIHAFRIFAGNDPDSPVVFVGGSKEIEAMAAALIVAERGTLPLTHSPTADYPCWTPEGARGSATALLAPSTRVSALANWGSHAAFLLGSNLREMSLGVATAADGRSSGLAVGVLVGAYGPVDPDPRSWPEPGWCPLEITNGNWMLWRPGVDLRDVAVSVEFEGAPLTVTRNQYLFAPFAPEPCIWFAFALAGEGTYRVRAENRGKPVADYEVTLFRAARPAVNEAKGWEGYE